MTPDERQRHFDDAEATFRKRMPGISYKPYCYARWERPDLVRGGWLVVGVFAVERAIELVQYVVRVHLETGERRIVKGWALDAQNTTAGP